MYFILYCLVHYAFKIILVHEPNAVEPQNNLFCGRTSITQTSISQIFNNSKKYLGPAVIYILFSVSHIFDNSNFLSSPTHSSYQGLTVVYNIY